MESYNLISLELRLQVNNIEIIFDADSIVVESYEIATYYDEYYDCEVPYIYENGILLEALAWYILFKYIIKSLFISNSRSSPV